MVADFHTLFNLVSPVYLLPILPLDEPLNPVTPFTVAVVAAPQPPLCTDLTARQIPKGAAETAAPNALRLADRFGEILSSTVGRHQQIASGSSIVEIRQRGDVLDSLNSVTRNYLTPPDPEQLAVSAHPRLHEKVHVANREGNRGIGVREAAAIRSNTSGLMATRRRSTLQAHWLTLQDLQVVQQLEPAEGETQSTLTTCVRWTACFDDVRLSMIGSR